MLFCVSSLNTTEMFMCEELGLATGVQNQNDDTKVCRSFIQAASRIPQGRAVRLRCWGGDGKGIIIDNLAPARRSQ